MVRDARRLSFEYQDETCPAVSNVVGDFLNNEFETLIERVKEVSAYKLRESLEAACSDLLDAREEVDRLKDEVETLKDTIDDLRSHIRELEREAA